MANDFDLATQRGQEIYRERQEQEERDRAAQAARHLADATAYIERNAQFWKDSFAKMDDERRKQELEQFNAEMDDRRRRNPIQSTHTVQPDGSRRLGTGGRRFFYFIGILGLGFYYFSRPGAPPYLARVHNFLQSVVPK